MNKLLQKLLYEHELALSVERSGKFKTLACFSRKELVWVLRSTRKEVDFYCAFIVEADLSEDDIIELYIKPAIAVLSKS